VTRVGKRWWIGGLVAAWALALLAVATWSVHNDPATVRGQTDLDSGRETLDRAVATMVRVAGPEVAAEIQPYEQTPDCRISMSRRGTEVDQTVVLTVPAGEEPRLLNRLAAELPAEWGALYSADSNRFRADAGNFVAIRGEVVEPGQVRLTAGTGCRPQ
jgi:hypothetical protein